MTKRSEIEMDLVDFKVELTVIDEVLAHPNADRLSIYKVKGWQVVGGKDSYKVGDSVVYVPVDSVLSEALEAKLFPPGSKITLNNRRVRAIKIRQFISQGMLISPTEVGVEKMKLGSDVAAIIGVTKYEPPAPAFQNAMGQSGKASKRSTNSHFKVYSKFPRIQNYPTMFKPDEIVVVTEKIHGTNFRAGWVPFEATSLWKKLLKFVGLAPKWQFVYGSHYVQLSEKFLYNGFYDKNVYAEMVKKYDLENRLTKGDVIYGEIYGAGIQKGYDYGLKERELIIFDIQRDGKYLNYDEFVKEGYRYNLPMVPTIFCGEYSDVKLDEVVGGNSILAPTQKVREGVVVKPLVEGDLAPRKGAKVINPEYLLNTENTDFH